MTSPEVGDKVVVGGEEYEVLGITEGETGPEYRIVKADGVKMLVGADQIETGDEPESESEAEAEAKAKAEEEATAEAAAAEEARRVAEEEAKKAEEEAGPTE